jgi:hypothetical protein
MQMHIYMCVDDEFFWGRGNQFFKHQSDIQYRGK